MNLATQKTELIKWINSIDDFDVLKKIESIKKEETFDFEKEWENAISIEEARKKSKQFIENLAWKK
jgi:hypothetical protein